MRDDAGAPHAAFSLTGARVGLPPDHDINRLGDRAAMGLPDACVDTDLSSLHRECARLLGTSTDALARIAEDPGHAFRTRFAAGLLLGLTGDPRISVFDPPMCDIPGGRYRLGLDRDAVDAVIAAFAAYGVRREWIEKETPAYTIALQAFRIGRYPVTHGEYHVFLQETGYPSLPSAWPFGVLPPGLANQPVHSIAAEDADAYAAWLSRRTGRRFRLPAEAEWELAAAGPQRFEYPWGPTYLPDRANTLEAGILAATPVGMFPLGASPFGCLDMAGNVEEYVADDYRPYGDGEAIRDDLHPAEGGYRIARGGSFTRYRDLARCRRRHGAYRKPIYVMGFRLAEDVDSGPSG